VAPPTVSPTTVDLNVGRLPHEYPRTFVPDGANLGEWAQIEPLLQALERAPLNTALEVQDWLTRRSELDACLGEEGSVRHIRMMMNTADETIRKAFMVWVEDLSPRLKEAGERLDRQLFSSPGFSTLGPDYVVFVRSLKNRLELFRQENIPLEIEEEKTAQSYQQLIGAMTVPFQGEDRTIPQLQKFLEEPDRGVRESAWKAMREKYRAEDETLETCFDRLRNIRQQQAKNAGSDNYRDYAFRCYQRFEYTPGDCAAFHEAVERHVVPLIAKLRVKRAERMGLSVMRPWDEGADAESRPPLKPFERTDQFVAATSKIFKQLDDEFSGYFDQMSSLGLLDLDNRRNKAPGGFLAMLGETRLPFIFMNAVGRPTDVVTLIHESGHAFHAYLCRNQPLADFRGSPLEFAEVASMGMELLSAHLWDAYYPSPDHFKRARADHWKRVVWILPWVATIDSFQHWMYTHPDHTREERAAKWLEIFKRFHPGLDISGLELLMAKSWHAQTHVFTSPFYYIEYGIAQLGALQLWRNAQQDPAQALSQYKKGLALGASRPLPELFQAAGLRFEFGAPIMAELMQDVEFQLSALGEL